MTEEKDRSNIKVTDHRHFDPSGERRRSSDAPEAAESSAAPPPGPPPPRPAESSAVPPPGPTPPRPAEAPARETETEKESARPSPQGGLSDLTAGISSSFSLLVARLAQETEIYLGMVPYPGRDVPEPDLEAARAMIDMLSMLEEKTRGNLDPQEARLLGDLIYTYRIEFVRRSPAERGER